MIKNCPICGKAFDVLYPDIWRYKRNNRFICSWKCIRLFDGKEEKQVKERVSVKRTRMSRDDMAEAVRMWKDNDPALDQYLTDHGITHIGKWKQNARDRYGVAAPATVKVDGPIRIETPEAHNVDIVETPEEPKQVIELHGIDTDIVAMNKQCNFDDRCTVSAIRVKDLGEFYYDKKFTSIDWRTPAGDEVSLGPAWWAQLAEDLPFILQKLGVNV
jgi:hypothetical protein